MNHFHQTREEEEGQTNTKCFRNEGEGSQGEPCSVPNQTQIIHLHGHRCKIPQENVNKLNPAAHTQEDNTVTHSDPAGFAPGMQGWFDGLKWADAMHPHLRIKAETHTIISTDEQKTSDEIQTSFLTK